MANSAGAQGRGLPLTPSDESARGGRQNHRRPISRHFSTGLCCLGFLWLTFTALAHRPGESYLDLKVQESKITGQWDIALRDLEETVGLDANRDGTVTWDEFTARQKTIGAFALRHLALAVNGQPCEPIITGYQAAEYPDGVYAVVQFEAGDFHKPRTLEITCKLFLDTHPQHRGLVNLNFNGASRVAVFSHGSRTLRFDLAAPGAWPEFLDFLKEGVRHIWGGFDHLLCLLALLLPAVLRRETDGWQAVESFRAAFVNVFKIVTAFTLAHSLTLSLAALGLVQLPSRFVESAIAASVTLAALNNLHPLLPGRGWVVAFAFGLVHGFGFASVLAEFGVGRGALLVPLVGFNRQHSILMVVVFPAP
ncbi:MAG: HupE/UreJ family protein, partial [Verrucomicrobia bacterium]|nr:HupE/UreJ family protein [Verrucomicrobiota bacterium]